MPLVRFDIFRGRPEEDVMAMLDAAHSAVVEVFGVPPRDRHQIVNEHSPAHLVAQDTGLGLTRSENLTIVRALSRPRTSAQKKLLNRLLAGRLDKARGISPSDLIVAFSGNEDEDWSFWMGCAQSVVGDL